MDCPICGYGKSKAIFVGDRYRMGVRTVICKKCGLTYTNPRPVDVVFDEFYEKHYRNFYESVEYPSEEYIREGQFAAKARIVYDSLKDFIEDEVRFSKPIEILDVGCSEGSVLRYILVNCPHEVVATGIEPSINFSNFAKEYTGVRIFNGSLEGFFRENHSSRFDVIILNHVLEHFLDPVKSMTCLHHLLKDDGIIFIEVPNILGKWSGISMFHIAHVFHFDEMTLKNLLARSGFSPITVSLDGNAIHPWAMSFVCRKDLHAKVVLPTRMAIKRKETIIQEKIHKNCRTPSSGQWFRRFLKKLPWVSRKCD